MMDVVNRLVRTRRVKERVPQVHWSRPLKSQKLLVDVGSLGLSLYRSILQSETGYGWTIMRGR